jgi:hypothetical protein
VSAIANDTITTTQKLFVFGIVGKSVCHLRKLTDRDGINWFGSNR